MCVPPQGGCQCLLVDATPGIEGDDLQLGDALAPGEFVGVVLIGADKDHWSLGLGQAQIQHIDQFVDGGGGPGTAKDHLVLAAAIDGCAHLLARRFPQGRGMGAGK